MKNFIILCLTVCGLSIAFKLPAAPAANRDLGNIDKAVLEQFGKLNHTIADINKNLTLLEKTKPRPEPQRELEKELRAIKYPEHPDREKVKQYLDEIQQVSGRYRNHLKQNLKITLLTRPGHKYLDLLLDLADGKNAYDPVNRAVYKLVQSGDKQLVIKHFDANHALINVIVRMGWEREVKDKLIAGLQNDFKLPPLWIVTVVGFREPSTYPAIVNNFVKAQNRGQFFRYIKDLPGINVEDMVARGWKQVAGLKNTDMKKIVMAQIAVSYGYVDALLILTTAGEDRGYVSAMTNRLLFQKYIANYAASGQDTVAWLKANKDRLFFDKTDKKYKLKLNTLSGGK